MNSEMYEASSPLIGVQAQTASLLDINAQDVQELKLQEFINGANGNYKPCVLDYGSAKSEGTNILLLKHNQDTFWGTPNGP